MTVLRSMWLRSLKNVTMAKARAAEASSEKHHTSLGFCFDSNVVVFALCAHVKVSSANK
jgi:hypothetical protein